MDGPTSQTLTGHRVAQSHVVPIAVIGDRVPVECAKVLSEPAIETLPFPIFNVTESKTLTGGPDWSPEKSWPTLAAPCTYFSRLATSRSRYARRTRRGRFAVHLGAHAQKADFPAGSQHPDRRGHGNRRSNLGNPTGQFFFVCPRRSGKKAVAWSWGPPQYARQLLR
jgi:hypothetical protein